MTEITLESKTGRMVPAWLYVAIGLVVVAVAAVGLQLHVLTAEVHAASAAITAQSERAAQCPAPAPVPETAEIVAAETEPAPARQAKRRVINAPVAASDTASTAWSEPTELDGALATFNRQLQEYGQ